MRLRPSGRQGPVATSLASFESYQREEAWTWEHLALTRARWVAGDAGLGAEVEAFRAALIAAPRDAARVLADVAEMRARLAEAKPAENAWEAKRGPGRMQDIDLVAQAAALLAGSPERQTPGQLAAGVGIGWFSEAEARDLAGAYADFWTVQAASRLLTGTALDFGDVGEGGRALMLRETGAATVEDLAACMAGRAAMAAGIVEAALARRPG